MRTLLKAKKIYTESGVVENGGVVIEGDRILECCTLPNQTAGNMIDLKDCILLPGLVDIHIHGGYGYDTMDATYEAINEISKYKIKEGVTSFCPTTVTAAMDSTVKAIENVNAAMERGVDGAKISGLFLEGPYINARYKGAHPENRIRGISIEEIKSLLDTGKGNILAFALAPELTDGDKAIDYLVSRGVVVKIGHSAATYEQAVSAIEKGAAIAIHTFNTMPPFQHREPGLVGAVLTEDIYAEIICDFIHVHPGAIRTLLKCKGPNKTILITDCMMAGGLPDGEYRLGEKDVKVADGTPRLSDGSLAGSTLTLLGAIRNLHQKMSIPLADAVKMATLTPACALGLEDEIGGIAPGKAADFLAVDENLNPRFVMVNGTVKRV